MKKMAKRVIVLLVVLVLLALAFPVANLIFKPANGGLLVGPIPSDRAWLIACDLFERKCVGCHEPNAKLPFYASLPIASGMVQADIARGLEYLDMGKAIADSTEAPVSEVVLAKIEHTIAQRTMPPARYLALHWDARIEPLDETDLAEWIAQIRKERFATAGVAEAFAAEVVQPLPSAMDADAGKVALGDRLFHDVRLSGDDTISCASCHALDKGGTDQEQFSDGINGAMGDINSPTVFNAVFQFRQFWDGRAADLFEQADGPVNNPIEMGSSWEQALPKLEADDAYVQAFTEIYGADAVTRENVLDAIAAFETTLITPNARFDQYLFGKEDALTADENQGYVRFKELGCANCHVGKALGGQSFEKMGRTSDYFAARGGEVRKADLGRFNVTQEESDRHRFKTPILRNLVVTAPYFHDGQTTELREAVEIMARHQILVPYAPADVDLITGFLKTLTGEYKGQPLSGAAPAAGGA